MADVSLSLSYTKVLMSCIIDMRYRTCKFILWPWLPACIPRDQQFFLQAGKVREEWINSYCMKPDWWQTYFHTDQI